MNTAEPFGISPTRFRCTLNICTINLYYEWIKAVHHPHTTI